MLRLLKSIALVLGLTGFAIFATNCGTDHAQMRLVHAIPDAGNQDAVVDGKTVATNVAFDSVSPATGYATVNAGNPKLEVRNTGSGTDLINSNVTFSSKAQYTVVATGCENPVNCNQTGTTSTVAPVVLTDNNSAPTSGNVNLRVVHASPSAGTSFDVYIVPAGTNISGMAPTISGLAYEQASGYQSVAPNSNEVIVTPAGTQNRTIDQTYTLTAGQVRTIVILDVVNGGAVSTTPLVLADLN